MSKTEVLKRLDKQSQKLDQAGKQALERMETVSRKLEDKSPEEFFAMVKELLHYA
jgi:hypothetical protein